MSTLHLSEQETLRREKLAELIMMGVEPYPAALYPVNAYSDTIREQFNAENKDQFADVCLSIGAVDSISFFTSAVALLWSGVST